MHTLPPAAEALYFDNAPVAHIVAYQERQRLQRVEERNRAALRGRSVLSRRFAS